MSSSLSDSENHKDGSEFPRIWGNFMQKEFTIQVLFCIDKARYERDKTFSSQRILEK